MNERIKKLRLFLNLTQEEFGKKLGVTRSAISYIESGRSNVTEQMLYTISLTFDVRKEWLQSGCGEMFAEHTISEALASYIGDLLAEDNLQKEKCALFCLKMIIDEWDLIEKNFDKFKDITKWIDTRPDESDLY